MTTSKLEGMKKTRTQPPGTPLFNWGRHRRFIARRTQLLLDVRRDVVVRYRGTDGRQTTARGQRAGAVFTGGRVYRQSYGRTCAAYRPSTTTCARMGSHCFLGGLYSAYRLGRPWNFCGVAACSNWSSFPKQPAHSRAYLPMESPFPHLGTAAVWGVIRLARSPPESAVNRLKTTRHMTFKRC